MGSTGRSRRLAFAAIGAGLAAALTLTGCTTETTPSAAGTDGAVSGAEQPGPLGVTINPGAGSVDVSPAAPTGIEVRNGTIESVTLTNPEGKQVKGTLAGDKRSWTVAEPLGYGKTYTWAGSAVGADGGSAPIAGSFTTAKPKKLVKGSLNTGDGQTYGVAMPIALSFDAPVKDRAAAQKALEVKTSVPTEGAWAWLDDRSVHWRPKVYWTPGTSVTVTAKLYGAKLGDGAYGRADVTSTFTIGRSQIAKANTQTHRLVVITDGVQTGDFAASYGFEADPGRVTKSGVHVVMSKHASYSMTNPKYNYENVVVPWAVRISNNGEFVHGYAPSIWAQGKKNISHGCVNLSPANAKIYFDGVLVGDPVEVTGSTEQMSSADGDYYDWAVTWEQWTAKSAL